MQMEGLWNVEEYFLWGNWPEKEVVLGPHSVELIDKGILSPAPSTSEDLTKVS